MAKWSFGQSGNPGGRPKGYGDLRELAREHTEEALQVLISVMQEETAPASARVSAAQHLLDRGWGRPDASLNVTNTGRSWVDELRAIQGRIKSDEQQQAKAALPSLRSSTQQGEVQCQSGMTPEPSPCPVGALQEGP